MSDSANERKISDVNAPHRKLSDTIPMESVQRLAKLPMVESSINMANDVYSRVKEASSMLNWTLTTAEETVSRAVEHAIPVAERLEKPLKRMDTMLCSSLDYVEAKVPAVKLPPHELLESTSSYVESKMQPAWDKAAELKQFGADKVSAVKNFAMESSSSSSQLVNSCTKIAATGMEVAQRYISNAGAQLTNGEATHVAGYQSNGYNGQGQGHDMEPGTQHGAVNSKPGANTITTVSTTDNYHPIYTAEIKRLALQQHTANGRGDTATLSPTPTLNASGSSSNTNGESTTAPAAPARGRRH